MGGSEFMHFQFRAIKTYCKYSNRMEDAIDAFKMIFDGKQSWLLVWTLVFMVSVAFFNYAGL